MRNRIVRYLRSSSVTLFLLTLTLTAAHGQTSIGQNLPAGVPSGYVITPFGYIHSSCVQLIAGPVEPENIPPCDHPRFTSDGKEIPRGAPNAAAEEPVNWLVSGSVSNPSSAYGKITATWLVPSNPVSNDDQVLYFFPGFADINQYENLLQPVLAWNYPPYTNAWSITSWNYLHGNALHHTPAPVSAGDAIAGTVKSTCGDGMISCPEWDVLTVDANTSGFSLEHNTPVNSQAMNWAVGGVMEAYRVKKCSDYPPEGSITFSVELYDDNFVRVPSPQWAITNHNGQPQCSYGGQTATTQVTLKWADPVSIWGTGHLAGSAQLAPMGAADGNFTYISCAGVCGNGSTPFVTLDNQYPFPLWLADTGTAQWVGPDAGGNENQSDPSGAYQYRETFDLTGFDLQTVALTGSYATDNSGYIQLNGATVGPSSSSYAVQTPFTISSGFIKGVNTLDFFVTNEVQAIDNPTGLFVQIQGSGQHVSSK